ncbi:hypothetical protein VTN00DRAFT_421 [Thermoascus crustaceus]|uniref:uncharacterized protein n=1 Tax=Thermoascus crustaceus TaxID=5088 RepID=UPI003743F428
MGLSTLASSSKARRSLRVSSVNNHPQLIPVVLLLSSSCRTLPRLASQPAQRRSLWQSSRRDRRNSWLFDQDEHIPQRIRRYKRLYMFKQAQALRRQAVLDRQSGQMPRREHPWWSRGWGWRGFQSSGPDNFSNKNEDYTQRGKDNVYKEQNESWWEAERARIEREMERLKKEIEADPYTALFGKRIEPLGRHDWHTSPWSAFCRSFLGLNDSKDSAKADGLAASKGAENSSSDTNMNNEVSSKSANGDAIPVQPSMASTTSEAETSFEFDPISGRMIPKKSSPPESSSQNTQVKGGQTEDVPFKTFKSYRAQFCYQQPEDKIVDDSKPQATKESVNMAQDHDLPSVEKDLKNNEDNKDVFFMNAPSTDSMSPTAPSSSRANGVSEQTNDGPLLRQPKETNATSQLESTPEQRSHPSGKNSPERWHQTSQQRTSNVWSYLATPNVRETGSETPGQSASVHVSQPKDYSFQEDRTDDVDLLRASDIRASFNPKKTKLELHDKKRKTRQALEDDFDSYQDPGSEIRVRDVRQHEWTSTVHADGSSGMVSGSRKDQPMTEKINNSKFTAVESEPRSERIPTQPQQKAATSPDAEILEPKEGRVTDEKLTRDIQKIYEDTYGEITPEHRQGRQKGEATPSESFQAQKATKTVAPISITEDLSPPSGKLPDMKIVTIGSSTEGDSSKSGISRESQLDALLKDAKQFNEQRDIIMKALTETIDRINAPRPEKLTQSSADKHPPLTTMTSQPAIYRILAYDSSTLQVTSAETTSSVCSVEDPLTPSEVLSRLNNPAKFLPYFAGMQADGYEIVSGGGDIIVFKKMREAVSRQATSGPVGTTDDNVSIVSPGTGAYSPEEAAQVDELIDQAIVNDKLQSKDSKSAAPSSSPPKMVRRQETIYTGGPPNWSPYPTPPPSEPNSEAGAPPKEESFIHRTSRRVLLAGVATAATCYAIGVVIEYFRTGGEDGRGPEGFTPFESERRAER